MSNYNEGCVELVTYGYNEPTRCLTFTVDFYARDREAFHELWKALHAVKYYNDFSAGRIIACFRELEDISGTIPGVSRIRFGREYSPVMYIDCVSKERAKELLRAFDYAVPDEADRTGKTIRLWWD